MPNTPQPLMLGAPVIFRDRWQGRLAAMDVDTNWEVLNVVIQRGVLRWSSEVKLPLSAATGWADDHITFDCTSRQAFGREIPPIAALAPRLSKATTVNLPRAVLSGLMVAVASRRASEIIVLQGPGLRKQTRIAVGSVIIQGDSLRITASSEDLPPYRTDSELAASVLSALSLDGSLGADDRRVLSVEAVNGTVRLSGNVRTGDTKKRIERIARSVPGAESVESRLVDDPDLELGIGRALDQSGLLNGANIYVRSRLGEVTISGYVRASRTEFEIVRVISAMAGPCRVKSVLELKP